MTSSPERRPRAPLTVAWTIVATVTLAWTVLVAWSPPFLDRVDEHVAGWLEGRPGPELLTWLSPSIRWWTALGTTIVAVLLALRCRVLAVGLAAASLTGYALTFALREVVEHARPPVGPGAGALDAFPSASVVQAVVLAGLVPFAPTVALGTRHVVRPMRLLMVVGAAAVTVDRVAHGHHWPSDVIGSVLLGLTLVLGVERALATFDLHEACDHCPWSPLPRAVHRHVHLLHLHGHRLLEVAAHLAAVVAVAGLLLVGARGGIPTNPEGQAFGSAVERPAQFTFTALVAIGALLAWRKPAIGAVLLAFAGAGLGIFASVEYEPRWALTISGVLMLPAILNWLSWQHRRPHGELVVVGAVTVALLGTTWVGATNVYDRYYGPTHPDSTAPALPVDRVEWLWTGALQPRAVTVTVKLAEDHRVAALVATPEGDATAVRSASVDVGAHRVARLRLDVLQPATSYALTVEVDGVADRSRGVARLRTPADGAQSFRLAVGSCARTSSNGAVLDEIARAEPLVFLELGDLHYRNLEATAPGPFLDAFDDVVTRPGWAALLREVPMAYVWDDHDYGPNNADAASPTRTAARTAYRTVVPDFGVAPGDAPVNQAFTIGRVRVVMTDGRSERTATSMLGDAQTQWLIDEVTTASRTHAVVLWASPSPWVGEADPAGDTWAAFDADRRRIADAFAAAGVRNLVMVAGDAHMVAIDDGTHTDYSTTGAGGWPLLQAAPLDRPGSIKGGPYTAGPFTDGGQFGLVDIVDDGGGSVQVVLTGRRWDGATLATHTATISVPASVAAR